MVRALKLGINEFNRISMEKTVAQIIFEGAQNSINDMDTANVSIELKSISLAVLVIVFLSHPRH